MAEILAAQGALETPCLPLVEGLVIEHLRRHGSDPERSLAAIGVGQSTRERLARIGNGELDASLAHVGSGSTNPDADPHRTDSDSVGTATSDGLRFRVLRPHARGGLGTIFVALDTELHREVALKQLLDAHADDEASRSRFLVEAEITGGLEHPGIVPIYGLGTYGDGRPYYAMRFIRGDSLKEAIERFRAHAAWKRDRGRRSLELRKLLRRFIDVCNAIDYAHSRGVLHRDIKPGNIIVGRHGETLVVDWGLAKATGRSDPASGERTLRPASGSGSAETLPGSALGTPAYMSPEQAEGDLERLGPRSDVYSLGATLYHLLTAKSPFAGDAVHVIPRVQRGDFPRPRAVDPSIDPALEAVCLKAMALQPGDRYGSCRVLAEDVERWMADEPVTAWREPRVRAARRWMRRHRTAVTATAVAAVVALAALSVLAAVQTRNNRQLRVSRDQADHRAELAIQAVDDFRKAVEENIDVKNRPDLEPLRRILLRAPHEFYRLLKLDLQGSVDVRAQTRTRLAMAYYQLALLTAEIGSQAAGIEGYQQAIEILSGQLSEFPSDRALRADLAACLFGLGGLQGDQGHPEQAKAAFQRARDLRASLTAEQPAGTDLWSGLADCETSLAALDVDHGRVIEAMASYQKALDIRQKLARAHPAPPDVKSGLADCHARIAALDADHGQPAKAKASYGKALAIREELAREHPELASAQIGLARVLNSLAALHAAHGRSAQAQAAYRRALEIQTRLARQQPTNIELQDELATGLRNLAQQQANKSLVVEARNSYREALKVQTKLAADNPGSFRLQIGLARSHLGLAGMDTDSGEIDEAIRLIGTAVEILDKLARDDPANVDVALTRERARRRLAELLNRSGRIEESLAAYGESSAIIDRLSAANPRHTLLLTEKAILRRLTSGVHYRLGRLEAAAAADEEALGILHVLARDDPENIRYLGELATIYWSLGNVSDDANQKEEAVDSWNKAIEIEESLTRDDPQNVENRLMLSMIFRDVGLFARRNHQYDKALLRYGQALALVESVHREHPEHQSNAENLASTYNSIGAIQDELGEPLSAVDYYRKALAVREEVTRAEPGNFNNLFGLALVKMNIGLIASQLGETGTASNHFLEAREIYRGILKKHPDHTLSHGFLGMTYDGYADVLCSLGRYDEALQNLGLALEVCPPRERDRYRIRRALILARGGRHERARGEVDPLYASRSGRSEGFYDLACVYARLAGPPGQSPAARAADVTRAISLLEKARDLGYFRSPGALKKMLTDPDLSILRSDRAFQLLMADLDMPAEPFARVH
jgi:serine/threonine-protein kinase